MRNENKKRWNILIKVKYKGVWLALILKIFHSNLAEDEMNQALPKMVASC